MTRLIMIAAAGLLTFLLAGCGEDNKPAQPTAAPTNTPANTSGNVKPAEQQGH